MHTLFRLPIFITILLLVSLSGCSTSNDESKNNESQSDPEKISQNSTSSDINQSKELNKPHEKIEKHMELTGTIVFKNLEGGFYGFVSDSGANYLPIGLENKHKKNGLSVKLKARKIEDMVSFHQFGENIEVLNVEVLSDSNVVPVQKEI